MTLQGSNKATWHSYTMVYSALFRANCGSALRIFEMGLGTGNPNISSNMGANARPGASLRGWREYFPRAYVFGADIDRDVLFEENRIRTFYCDQLDAAALRELWDHPALRDGMDVIIDDGLHTFEANTSFLDASLGLLNPGGFFIVEDIHRDAIPQWRERLSAYYCQQLETYTFVLLSMRHPINETDNNMLIIGKPRAET